MYWLDWLKSLLGLVVLLGLLEHLLPSGEVAKFAKLVLGLVLMLAVLQPLILLLNQDPGSIDLDFSWFDTSSSEPEVQMLAERVQQAAAAPFVRQEEAALTATLEKLLRENGDLVDIRVEMHLMQADPLIKVYVHPYASEIRASVIAVVASTLNLPENQIQVQDWSQ